MRSLVVYIDQRRIGELYEGEDIWRFVYDANWAVANDAFDLAPGLPRSQREHIDGATHRTVQWYFDNLLPEELLRQAISKEANIKGEDAFALLEYLGAESAGSLTLLPPDQAVPSNWELIELSDEELSRRIAALPVQTLSANAPKRMSLAGAQHKLLVVLDENKLYEPVGATPSTHILKPNHQVGTDYPASVMNEYVTMRLAEAAGLVVPRVDIRYVPDPIYIIERFDRIRRDAGSSQPPSAPAVERLHIIDACQLLNRARTFKYSAATLEALRSLIESSTNKAHTRLALYRWLVFNVLVGNDDAHLKNLSFFVSAEGIELAPHYDLLATSAYRTRAIANEAATWPNVDMAIPLPGAKSLKDVTQQSLLEAGAVLGVPQAAARRTLTQIVGRVNAALKLEVQALAARHDSLPISARGCIPAEQRLMRVMENIVVREMTQRMTS